MSFSRIPLSRLCLLALGAAMLNVTALPAWSQTIVQNVGGGLTNISDQFRGQSFLTPAGGPWDNIRFNFFSDRPATTPFVLGTGYLLSQEYLGTPTGLSNAVPGFLGQSTGIIEGAWVFPSALTLQPNTEYWVYGDTQIPMGGITGGNDVPGNTGYLTVEGGTPFSSNNLDANYRVSSTAVSAAAPEPGTLALLSVGLGMAWFGTRRRMKQP